MPDIYHSEKLPLREVEQIRKEETTNPLASFVASPKKCRFETQEREEKILLILRGHWLVNAAWILQGLVLSLVPLVVLAMFSLEAVPFRFKLIGILIWYLLLAGFIFERFLSWVFNVFIITDERIIDFDFYGLIYKEISDAKTENIEDVTYVIGGFIRNFFDFGSVFIQTAAQVPQFEFHDVPQPGRVAKILRELITEEEIEKMEGRVR